MIDGEKESMNLETSSLAEYFEAVRKAIRWVAKDEFVDPKATVDVGTGDGGTFKASIKTGRKPILVLGPPGIGKTVGLITSIKEFNEELERQGHPERKFKLQKIMLGQTIVGELQGMPAVVEENGEKKLKRLTSDDLPQDPNSYGVLFLDEITTADEAQILPALGFTDDTRSIQGYKLPEHWIVVCAGNGPECSNFVRLDKTITNRCRGFNIEYDYEKDLKDYAHGKDSFGRDTGKPFHPSIRAFLEFEPTWVYDDPSDEEDKAASYFASPRSWEALSEAMYVEEYMSGGKIDDIYNFSQSFIGKNAASKFMAFMAYKPDTSDTQIADILSGKWRKKKKSKQEEQPLMVETFHFILESLISNMLTALKNYAEKDANGELVKDANGLVNYSQEAYDMFANVIAWITTEPCNSAEVSCKAIFTISNSLPGAQNIVGATDFFTLCPEFADFCTKYADVLTMDSVDVKSFA